MEESYRPKGRIYLYACMGAGGKNPFTAGTFEDLKTEGIIPSPGMRLQFYSDDANEKGEPDYLLFSGVIGCDTETKKWYAVVDDWKFWHESDLKK